MPDKCDYINEKLTQLPEVVIVVRQMSPATALHYKKCDK